jgi:hypothetical protein
VLLTGYFFTAPKRFSNNYAGKKILAIYKFKHLQAEQNYRVIGPFSLDSSILIG